MKGEWPDAGLCSCVTGAPASPPSDPLLPAAAPPGPWLRPCPTILTACGLPLGPDGASAAVVPRKRGTPLPGVLLVRPACPASSIRASWVSWRGSSEEPQEPCKPGWCRSACSRSAAVEGGREGVGTRKEHHRGDSVTGLGGLMQPQDSASGINGKQAGTRVHPAMNPMGAPLT